MMERPDTNSWSVMSLESRCEAQSGKNSPICTWKKYGTAKCGYMESEALGFGGCPVAKKYILRALTEVDTSLGMIIIKISPDGKTIIGEKNESWVQVSTGVVSASSESLFQEPISQQ